MGKGGGREREREKRKRRGRGGEKREGEEREKRICGSDLMFEWVPLAAASWGRMDRGQMDGYRG